MIVAVPDFLGVDEQRKLLQAVQKLSQNKNGDSFPEGVVLIRESLALALHYR